MPNQISEAAEKKTLGHDDESGFYFAKEMLGDTATAAVNFDRLQKHPTLGYIIFEYLLCEADQPHVTPFTSHPKNYWEKDRNKFLSLWRAALDLKAKLYLVNYAKKGTRAENEILLIEVLDLDETGILKERTRQFTRAAFKTWFSNLNKACLTGSDSILYDIYAHKTLEELGARVLDFGKHKGESLADILEADRGYLEWLVANKVQGYPAVQCFLDKEAAQGTADN